MALLLHPSFSSQFMQYFGFIWIYQAN